MPTSNTPADAPARRLKHLALEVPSFEVGPEGVPIFYGTEESPVIIRGRVVFHTQHECKGNRILVLFSAVETVEWRVSSGNMDRVYTNRHEFKVQEYKLNLPHLPFKEKVDPTSGKTITVGAKNRVVPGTYSLDFTIPIDPLFPSSCAGYCGKMVYKLQATLIRDFPSSNVICKQKLWVLNSPLPPPTIPLELNAEPLSWRVYSGIFEGDIKYKCCLPSYPICLGYSFPLWLRLDSISPQETGQRTSTSDQQTPLESRRRPLKKEPVHFKVTKGKAVILERRWYLSSGGYEHFSRRKLLKVDLIQEQGQYPYHSGEGDDNVQKDHRGEDEHGDGVIRANSSRSQGHHNKLGNSTRWGKIVLIHVPNVWAINPDSRTALITTQHALTVNLDIRYGFLNTRTLTFDVPLVIQVPRPPSCPSNRHDLIPSVLGL